ncbi:MAG: GTP-binding protein [Betaproteobacteria bacterium]|nr:GTP-binding protein [Betaproteobacteria bacterium]
MTTTIAPLPLVVIGGYLGAGKTTLVNRLLREAQPAGQRLAVLVNDFGEVPIDADLVVGAAGEVLALAGGCVCCAFGADLVGALAQMAARVPRPDALLVETSGVALPAAVARTAALAVGVRVDGVVVLADVAAVRAQAGDRYVGDVVRQQLGEADLVLLAKADLAGGDETAAVVDWLRVEGVAAPAVVLPGPQDETASGLMQALVFGPQQVRAQIGAEEPGDERRRASAWPPRPLRPTGASVLAPAADRFEHRTQRFTAPQDVAALGETLRAEGVLRAKGALLDVSGRWLELQVAGGRVHCRAAMIDGADAADTQAPAGRLVVLTLRRELEPARA